MFEQDGVLDITQDDYRQESILYLNDLQTQLGL